jgi:VanZ family protein
MSDRAVPLFRIAFVLCALAVFGLAVMPGNLDPVHVWDKAKHFFAFFVLGGLGALAFPRQRLVVLGLLLSGFGALIEVVQALPFVHRDASVKDWIADSVALLVVLCLFELIRRNAVRSFKA